MALLSSLFKNPLVPGTKLRLGSIEVVLRYGFVKSRLWKPKSKSGAQRVASEEASLNETISFRSKSYGLRMRSIAYLMPNLNWKRG